MLPTHAQDSSVQRVASLRRGVWKINLLAVRPSRLWRKTVLQAPIENTHEDLIGKRLANKRARLSLAQEAHNAVQVFGQETKHEVTNSGRESLRHACIPAERSDSQTTAR